MSTPNHITEAVRHYLHDLFHTPVDGSLEHSLKDVLQAEKDVRLLFGTNPSSPLLDDRYLGLVDVFSIHPAVRRTRARDIKPDSTELYDHYVFPIRHQTQRRSDLTPSTVPNVQVFKQHWKIFTHGALSKMKDDDWMNVIAAGGSVLACLMPPDPKVQSPIALNEYYQSKAYVSSDIDLFLWGLSAAQAEEKMLKIYQAVCAATPWYVTCVRKANVVSIHSHWPRRPIQIILRLYQSPAEILAGFDIDAACCAYDGKQVWVNPRALTALVCQAITVNITGRSPTYEIRLVKYAERGFEIYVPSLCRERVTSSIYAKDLLDLPNGLARLLVLEAAYYDPHFYIFREILLRRFREGPARVPEDEDHNSDHPFIRGSYDSNHGWTKIPYGKLWTAEKIQRMVNRKDAWMNSSQNEGNEGIENYHRHIFFAGTMQECLGYFCRVCAIIDDMLGSASGAGTSQLYIKGAIQFITKNPGHQLLTGSFRPIELGDWAREAYGQQEGNQ